MTDYIETDLCLALEAFPALPGDIVIQEGGVVHGNGTNLTLFAADIDSDETRLECDRTGCTDRYQ